MRRVLVLSFIFSALAGTAQQRLTLEQCESLFQQNNLLLLAEQYNVSASEAAVIQAKIWDLPVLSGEMNLYNPNRNQYFDAGQKGQKAVQVQQLIYLGGKKKNEVDFAKSNVNLAKINYEQLLRSLNFELHKAYYDLYFSLRKVESLSFQLAQLDTLINAYVEQSNKGNIPLKDVVRLQSLALAFRNELNNIQLNVFAQQQTLKLLLNTFDDITPDVVETKISEQVYKPVLIAQNGLLETGFNNNLEYKQMQTIVKSQELYLKWQRSLAVPDVALGTAYDQRGGAFNNQMNLTLTMPLPVWNRNKGNIKIAENELSQANVLLSQKEREIKTRIATELANFNYQQGQLRQNETASDDLETVFLSVLENFQRRNVSMIEFTDFMESYNQSVLFINELKKQVVLEGETLNYLVNEKVF